MRTRVKGLIAALAGVAFIVIVIGSYVIVAQTAITGEWKADGRQRTDDKIYLSFERHSDKGNRNQNGSTYSYEDLKGLSRDPNGPVSFSIVREAGTIECQGNFAGGKGSGTFTFSPNRSFIDGMRSRGFDFEKYDDRPNGEVNDRLLTAALINVTTALADDLNSANLGTLDVSDLFKAAIFQVNSEFIAEMKATGFPDLKMEDLVKARIFKIDANYVRQVRDMGFDKEDFEGLVKFRIFKVTPEFLSELRSEGFNDLSAEQVVKFRIFNIDSDFIRRAKASEPNITVEQLVQMKIGVRRSSN
jgi:hypothetical protein